MLSEFGMMTSYSDRIMEFAIYCWLFEFAGKKTSVNVVEQLDYLKRVFSNSSHYTNFFAVAYSNKRY